MKFLFGIVFLLVAIGSVGQEYPDSGFTNKAEAKNKLKNNLKEGKWVEYVNASNLGLGLFDDNDSVCQLTVYKNGNPYGLVRIYQLNGKLWCTIPYKNGKKNGVEKEYGETGKVCIFKIPWINDTINGPMKEYYEDGKLKWEAMYVNNEPNGIVRDYYESGKVESETTYSNGTRGATKRFDENGNETK